MKQNVKIVAAQKMPHRHFYLLRHHILFHIKFLFSCLLTPDGISYLICGKEEGCDRRKVTKCNTYKNSLSFTMVSFQFSKKFYYSGCLTSSLRPVKNKGIVQKYTISIQMETSRRNASILQTLISRKVINFWGNPLFFPYKILISSGAKEQKSRNLIQNKM